MLLVFPSDDAPIAPSWWAPLELVHHLIADDPRYRFFELADFMLMAKIVRQPCRPDVLLYKHSYTRRYLNLDETGEAYRYHPPRSNLERSGSYRRHRSLREALDALGLWELPWMKRALEHHACGLSWHDRWLLHPDADADGDIEGDTGADARRPGPRLRVV